MYALHFGSWSGLICIGRKGLKLQRYSVHCAKVCNEIVIYIVGS
ncbi:hypothetical protein SPHINGO361_100057 [Sphingomonas sp. EC-HK361]|nr:hypothetical protein SPHINGO361_100057 [Sphingomonas sp. EC-HK361]